MDFAFDPAKAYTERAHRGQLVEEYGPFSNRCGGTKGCGAVVDDKIQHIEYHLRLDRLEESLKNASAGEGVSG